MTDRILSHLLGIKAFITLFNLTPLRNYLWGEGWRNCSAVKRMCCFFRELVSSTHVRQLPVSLVLPYSSPSSGLWTQHEFYYLQKYGRGFTYRSRNISKTAMAKKPMSARLTAHKSWDHGAHYTAYKQLNRLKGFFPGAPVGLSPPRLFNWCLFLSGCLSSLGVFLVACLVWKWLSAVLRFIPGKRDLMKLVSFRDFLKPSWVVSFLF